MARLLLTLCCVLGIACSSFVAALPPVDMTLIFDSGGVPDFTIYMLDTEWFRSGPVGIRAANKWWSSNNKDKFMLKAGQRSTEDGEDLIGQFTSYKFTWEAYSDVNTSAGVKIETAVKVYANDPVLVFDITYLTGLTGSSLAGIINATVSSFPSFVVEENVLQRGYLTWSGNMAKDIKIGRWSVNSKVFGDVDGGFPLVVFDSRMEHAVVLSPLNTFTSANQHSFKDDQSGDTLITFGPMSSIDTIPAGYKYSTILVGGNNVTGTMKMFGEILRRFYGKKDDLRKNDFTINYLGYWTDNGACYYYTTGSKQSNYEDLLVAVKEDADKMGLPFRYMQLDSWWYYQDKDGGVKNWTARPDIFPNGIDSVVKKTGWRPVAHNRWWSPQTDYQKQYKFIIEKDAALPVDPSFWDYLISSSQTEWGLMVYEQDWLFIQFIYTKALQTELNLGRKWLKQMGDSAEKYGITIQYCMPWTRHVLQSVEIPAVTQIRVSDDYQPGNSQWVIGDTSILAHAMGLAAFKDNFRTSMDQPDCHNYSSKIETYPTLETYVAALSGGPIGPSDQMETANVTLVMATCMKDGHLLKPSRPAMSIDSTFQARCCDMYGPSGYVWAAFTEISSFTWYYIFAAQLEYDYFLYPRELPPSRSTFPLSSFPMSIAYQYTLDGRITNTITDFEIDTPINLSECGKSNFQYWAVAPMLDNSWALLGELNKIIPVSETRFTSIESVEGKHRVHMHGAPKETVTVTLFDKSSASSHVTTVDCVFGDSREVVLSIPSNTC